MKKIIFTIVLISFLFLVTPVKSVDCDRQCLNDEINQYTQKIHELQGQAKTLSNQISSYNAQITLAELKVQQTEGEINLLGGRIDQVGASLSALNEAFSARAVLSYKMARTEEASLLLLSAQDLTDAVSKFHYLQQVEGYDQSLMTKLQSAQNTYIADKQKSQDLQKQLQANEDGLSIQKNSKAQLLAQTKGSEANYQSLLAAAQAQLAAFSAFTANLGGASLLSNQTDCGDSWGCYYNQRDTQWGALALNGTQYSLASDGCLVTSMAMIFTFFGHKNVTPIYINSNANNFWASYPPYLNYPISADALNVTIKD